MISRPFMVIFHNWTTIFEWFVIRCGCKKAHKKWICSKEIGLCTQNMVTNSSSIANVSCEGGGGI